METRDVRKEFQVLMQETCKPRFKEKGFKKERDNYYRKNGELIQTVMFQKSPWNNKDEIQFTCNIGILEEEIYLKLNEESILPKFPKYTDSIIQLRIGKLINKRGNWYELKNVRRNKFEDVQVEFEADVKRLLKKLDEYEELKQLRFLFQRLENINPYWGKLGQYAIYKRLGRDYKAKRLLRRIYKEEKPRENQLLQTLINPFRIRRFIEEQPTHSDWLNRIEKIAGIYQEDLK